MNTHPGLDGEPTHLDYNATTPIDPAVVAATQPHLATGFGNPVQRPSGPDAPGHSQRRCRRCG